MEAATLSTLEPRSRGRRRAAGDEGAPARPEFELRCSACGYGVVVRIAPETCPMCLGTVWEHPPRLRRSRAPW